MVTNLFEGAKAISDCHESIITAANQSEPETASSIICCGCKNLPPRLFKLHKTQDNRSWVAIGSVKGKISGTKVQSEERLTYLRKPE